VSLSPGIPKDDGTSHRKHSVYADVEGVARLHRLARGMASLSNQLHENVRSFHERDELHDCISQFAF